MGNERRRDYMVNQRVHALYMVTWITSLLLVAAAVMTGISLYKLATRQPVDVYGINAYPLVGGLVFVIVASALTLGVYSILHTHRMLGSAFHIGTHLSKINNNEPVNPITLRDGDYFKEIADEINKLHPRLGVTRPTPPAGASAPPPPANPPAT